MNDPRRPAEWSALLASHAELLACCEQLLKLYDVARVTGLSVKWTGAMVDAMREAVARGSSLVPAPIPGSGTQDKGSAA